MTLGVFMTIIFIVVAGLALMVSVMNLLVPAIEGRWGLTGWATSMVGIAVVVFILIGFHIHLLLQLV